MNQRQSHQRIVKREEEHGLSKEMSVPLIQIDQKKRLSGQEKRLSGQKKRPDQSLFLHVM